MSIHIVKAFLTKSPQKLAKKLRFGGKTGSKCKLLFFWDPKRHIFARNHVIWGIDRKKRCRGLGCRL